MEELECIPSLPHEFLYYAINEIICPNPDCITNFKKLKNLPKTKNSPSIAQNHPIITLPQASENTSTDITPANTPLPLTKPSTPSLNFRLPTSSSTTSSGTSTSTTFPPTAKPSNRLKLSKSTKNTKSLKNKKKSITSNTVNNPHTKTLPKTTTPSAFPSSSQIPYSQYLSKQPSSTFSSNQQHSQQLTNNSPNIKIPSDEIKYNQIQSEANPNFVNDVININDVSTGNSVIYVNPVNPTSQNTLTHKIRQNNQKAFTASSGSNYATLNLNQFMKSSFHVSCVEGNSNVAGSQMGTASENQSSGRMACSGSDKGEMPDNIEKEDKSEKISDKSAANCRNMTLYPNKKAFIQKYGIGSGKQQKNKLPKQRKSISKGGKASLNKESIILSNPNALTSTPGLNLYTTSTPTTSQGGRSSGTSGYVHYNFHHAKKHSNPTSNFPSQSLQGHEITEETRSRKSNSNTHHEHHNHLHPQNTQQININLNININPSLKSTNMPFLVSHQQSFNNKNNINNNNKAPSIGVEQHNQLQIQINQMNNDFYAQDNKANNECEQNNEYSSDNDEQTDLHLLFNRREFRKLCFHCKRMFLQANILETKSKKPYNLLNEDDLEEDPVLLCDIREQCIQEHGFLPKCALLSIEGQNPEQVSSNFYLV